MRLVSMFLAAALGASSSAAQDSDAGGPWTLGLIEIETDPIYSAETAARSPLAALANATHWTTRDAVVRREIWIRPGDPISRSQAAELERNLRATGLFAEAVVTLRETDDPRVRDLVVRTRDRLSISGGASASLVGDFVSSGVSLGESNLFGTGDRLQFSFRQNEDAERRGAVAYRDRYFLGSWTTFFAEAGRSDNGDFSALGFDRPFRHLADNFAWNVGARTGASDQNYYDRDELVLEAPFDEDVLSAAARWRRGTRESFWTRGVRAGYTARAYGAPEGPAAAGFVPPGDTRSVFAGATIASTEITEFRETRGLDTIDFVQDLQLGTRASAVLGVTHRDEKGEEAQLQPTVGVEADIAFANGPSQYFTAGIAGDARVEGGEAVGWSLAANLHAYDLSFRPQTFAASLRYAEADESQGLPVQLVLGEGNGLRGYPRRQFTGQRLLGLNLEDRIDLDARIGAFHFGAVIFVDVGWIANRGESLGAPLRSTGFGLRVGSESLLGANVIRLDVSFPLDDDGDESFSPLFSASLGQVFTFR